LGGGEGGGKGRGRNHRDLLALMSVINTAKSWGKRSQTQVEARRGVGTKVGLRDENFTTCDEGGGNQWDECEKNAPNKKGSQKKRGFFVGLNSSGSLLPREKTAESKERTQLPEKTNRGPSCASSCWNWEDRGLGGKKEKQTD